MDHDTPPTPQMDIDAQRDALLKQVVQLLGEHFDAVQVLVSWNEEARTELMTWGCGNWYARRAMAQDFIERDQAQTTADEIRKQMPPPPADDGEAWKHA